VLPVATGRKGTFPIACSVNVGFGVGLAEWGSKSTFALQDSESHMSALGVRVGHLAMSAQCPAKADNESRFRSRGGPQAQPKAAAATSRLWFWMVAFGRHEDRTPTHGYVATREAATFAKSWRRK